MNLGNQWAKRAWLHGFGRRRQSTVQSAEARGLVVTVDPRTVSYRPPVQLPGETKGRKRRRLNLLKRRVEAMRRG